jgi:NADP-dependent 3-hydroxy acid dehydrogenase YdfG
MNEPNLGVALVTGASSGIGHATAKALRNAGFRVFGTSRRAAAERSDGAIMLSCDVTDDASVAKLVDEVLAEAGRIDVLVNNAGIGLLGGAEESSTAQAQALFDVNVFGVLRMTKAVGCRACEESGLGGADISPIRKSAVRQSIQLLVAVVATITLSGCYVAP